MVPKVGRQEAASGSTVPVILRVDQVHGASWHNAVTMSGLCCGTRVLSALLVVCGMAGTVSAQEVGCSVSNQNLFVREVMTDLYLWYDQVPAVDPVRYDSPAAYLDAVRARPRDSFSYIAPRASEEAFFSDSQFVGFGFALGFSGAQLAVVQVFPGGPASEAGLVRGDVIAAIGGVPVLQLYFAGQLEAALGAPEAGVGAEFDIVSAAEAPRRVPLVKRLVTIPTVTAIRDFEVGDRRVGYLFFRNFVEPSVAALDAAFAELKRAGVNELILDLRYNGGGLVSVAQHLASLIGGTTTAGAVFGQYEHNNRYTSYNRRLLFEEPPAQALSLSRLVVITSRSSASASEQVINALRPFMPVVIVGDRTYGKPVGQYAIPFCDKVLAPVSFSLKNAAGDGDFFDGLTPDCSAADDLGHQLGEPQEASLREALAYLASGRCSEPTATPARVRPRSLPFKPRGWSSVINAH